MAARIYLTGHVALESGDTLIGERHLAGRQGRIAFVYLVVHRTAPVSRDALVDIIWPDDPPAELESALSAILSKVRGALKQAGIPGASLELRMGAITLRLPSDTQVDVENAANAIDEAEGQWRRHDARRAWANANVAVAVTSRPFLARESAPWIETQRQRLRTVLCRGLDLLAAISVANGETSLGLHYATELVRLEPFRETGYQQLMRLHAQLGNRGEALRVFAGLREMLRDELGTSPSPQTEAVYMEILNA